jgi:hypothetical protein
MNGKKMRGRSLFPHIFFAPKPTRNNNMYVYIVYIVCIYCMVTQITITIQERRGKIDDNFSLESSIDSTENLSRTQ